MKKAAGRTGALLHGFKQITASPFSPSPKSEAFIIYKRTLLRHRNKLTSPLRQTNYFLASHYSYHSHVSFLQQLCSFLITAVFFSYNSCCKNNKKHKNCQSAVYR